MEAISSIYDSDKNKIDQSISIMFWHEKQVEHLAIR